MAAGPFVVLEAAQQKIGAGIIDLATHAFKAVLLGSAQVLTPDFAGTSTDALYADLTDELTTAGGYVVGGIDITGVTWATATPVTTFDADDLVWAALTKPGIKYVAIFDNTDADDSLLGYMDLEETDPAGVDSGGADFSILWSASGLFTLQQTGL